MNKRIAKHYVWGGSGTFFLTGTAMEKTVRWKFLGWQTST